MSQELAGRIAVVIGASSGIGSAIATTLAAHGALEFLARHYTDISERQKGHRDLLIHPQNYAEISRRILGFTRGGNCFCQKPPASLERSRRRQKL